VHYHHNSCSLGHCRALSYSVANQDGGSRAALQTGELSTYELTGRGNQRSRRGSLSRQLLWNMISATSTDTKTCRRTLAKPDRTQKYYLCLRMNVTIPPDGFVMRLGVAMEKDPRRTRGLGQSRNRAQCHIPRSARGALGELSMPGSIEEVASDCVPSPGL